MDSVGNSSVQQEKNDSRSLTWYLACRTAVITFLLGGAAVFYVRGTTQRDVIVPLFLLIAISYFAALLSALILKYFKRLRHFTEMQIVWDLLFVTVLILLTGGVESVFSFAYLLIIVFTSFLLTRRMTIIVAACSTILFGGILDLQYFGYLEFLNLGRPLSDGTFLSVIFVHSVAFFLTAGLSGTLAERWRQSEAQLHKKTVDYADLEKMNRTILAHISSGLMLVGPLGRIRSFNRAAEDITGFSLLDVYDQDAVKFFPGLVSALRTNAAPASRAECRFTNKSGDTLILGYATTPARGNQGEFLGTLVTFQDLTQLKKVEEDLKRADRLAAVGRLAAGMAHEIRNPLAAISGSVQMLMESSTVRKDDLGLMEIVVKEADRLNSLLTDFLTFARPKVPVKHRHNVITIVDELVNMLQGDRRFCNIDIRISTSGDAVLVDLDRDMVFQILWDLAVNAMEAMEGRGILRFVIQANKGDDIYAIVEDSGPGISEDIKGRIFEPFFSTKETGTGLGLASVYSVMEMHGGRVTVEQSELGGARFLLCFLREGSLK